MQSKTGQATFSMKKKGEELGPGESLVSGDFPRFKLVTVPDQDVDKPDSFDPPIINPVAILTGFDVRFEESESGPFEGQGRPFWFWQIRSTVLPSLNFDTERSQLQFGER
jgi:hypothetical protein